MALERLTLAPVVLHSSSTAAAAEDEEPNSNTNKAPRLPRWTRQELLVLIQGKRVAENRVRRGRIGQQPQQVVEPKWSSVSSYCKRHGVNRGPVQCRKRWSNLAGDFKKIKEWESQLQQLIKKEDEASSAAAAESFWIMRNDLRRERKLPGFFDREVYDILSGEGDDDNNNKKSSSSLVLLSLAPSAAAETETTEKEEKEVVFDSGRRAADEDDDDYDDGGGLFPSEQQQVVAVMGGSPAAPTPVSAAAARGYESFSQEGVPPPEEEETPGGEASPRPQVRKRKRDAAAEKEQEEEMSVQRQLIEAMERNNKLLTSQLEIQNTNSQLDREQRRNEASSLFSVLNKLADAMVRIADKL